MVSFQELKLNSKDPVYQQVAMYVKRLILLKRVHAGDQLPSRREIAAQLNINPNTVQKAFKLMEDEGYIRTDSTLGSVIRLDDATFNRIEQELTRELVLDFIASSKEIQLSFQAVIALISEHWD